jgi:hypothetical protein
VDKEDKVAVIAQCYLSERIRDKAKANKAADLNIAIAWLLQREIEELPLALRPNARHLREALTSGAVERLEIWFVHNLPESGNVGDEMLTVEHTASSLVGGIIDGRKPDISALEIGKAKIEEWYKETLSPILVEGEIKFSIDAGYLTKSTDWEAYVTSIQAKQLFKLYREHKTRLFSANVRDYLGSRASDANINNGIKRTSQEEPENFWVFNNGITLLTHSFREVELRKKKYLVVDGLSIVNGAQTTGAIGTLSKSPKSTVNVPARFVSTPRSDIVNQIIQYNNSQNKVSASDFRSTDRIQKRLKDEISKIPGVSYEGGRRGGHTDAIRRIKSLIPSYTAGQALAAFREDPVTAYNKKTEIWVNDQLYSRFFNDELTGQHIIFCFGLLRAVEEHKKSLVQKSAAENLTKQEEELLAYYRHRGSTLLLVSAIATCCEILLGRRVSNVAKLSFGPRTSHTQAANLWSEIVAVLSVFSLHLQDALNDGLKNTEKVKKAIMTFRNLVQSTAQGNETLYKKFRKHVPSGT